MKTKMVSTVDKEYLYYMVIEGTSSRSLDEGGCPIIFMHDFVDDFLFKANDVFAKQNYVKISVEEYERTFTEMLEY